MQEILEQIVSKFDEGEFVLVVGQDDISRCYSTASQMDVYFLLLQAAKSLSNLRAAEERVAQSCLLKSGGQASDDVAFAIAGEMEEFPHFLVAVRLKSGEFSVWGKGYPVVLCYYALRTCVQMETMNEGPFDAPSISPFVINLN